MRNELKTRDMVRRSAAVALRAAADELEHGVLIFEPLEGPGVHRSAEVLREMAADLGEEKP